MKVSITAEQALSLYIKRTEENITKMYQVLFRAQRKVDDDEYRKQLAKLQELT